MGLNIKLIFTLISAVLAVFLGLNKWLLNLIPVDELFFWLLFIIGIVATVFGILAFFLKHIIWIPIVFYIIFAALMIILAVYIYMTYFAVIIANIEPILAGDFSSITNLLPQDVKDSITNAQAQGEAAQDLI